MIRGRKGKGLQLSLELQGHITIHPLGINKAHFEQQKPGLLEEDLTDEDYFDEYLCGGPFCLKGILPKSFGLA